MSSDLVDTEASYGLFSEDENPDESRTNTPDEAAERFRLLLRHHLERIHHATEEREIVLIVENMSSRPEQQEILASICEELGIPLVPLQDEFANHPERDAFLHPTQSLRLSPAGNSFMAEQIYREVRPALDALSD